MKVPPLLLIACFSVAVANGQKTTGGESYNSGRSNQGGGLAIGPRVGYNLSYMIFSERSQVSDNSPLSGWMAGIMMEIGLGRRLGLLTGLDVLTKGTKTQPADPSFPEETTRLTYLQAPVLLTANQGRFFVGLGPFAAYGIAGKSTSGDDKTDIIWGNDKNAHFSPWDAGIQAEAGLKFGKLRLGAQFGQGLLNTRPDALSLAGAKTQNWNLGVYVGYMFF